jgi:kynurenine formamidase
MNPAGTRTDWLAATLLFFALSFAQGAEPPAPVGNWGKWGSDDQRGTLNYITPQTVLHALTLVRQGKIINLSLPFEPGHPNGTNNRDPQRYMISTAQGAGKRAGTADDILYLATHGGTHWDGLAHFFAEGKLYNGFPVEQFATPRGVGRVGIEHAATSLVTRGVLLDVARYRGVPSLPRDYQISVADLRATARRQGVSFRAGDMLLIHTGGLEIWYRDRAAYRKGHPGIVWEVTAWLKTIQAAAIALDTQDIDLRPAPLESRTASGFPAYASPIHVELLRNQGMMGGDLFHLSDLAADCAADGVYEFLFIGSPLHIVGATGSPVNPLAIK